MKSKRFLVMLMVGGALFVTVHPVSADLVMTQANHTDAFEVMGQKQPERFDTTNMWIGEKFSRADMADTTTMLFDLEKHELIAVNHVDKTYAVMPLNFGEMVDRALEGEDAEEAEAAKDMMKATMGSMKCDVTPTDETKKIRDWNARKYNVDMSIMMMNFNNEIWATEDIKFDWKAYYAMTEGMLSQMPGAENLISAMMEVKGVPVLTISTGNMMGATFKATSELVECVTKDAPVGWYAIPEGYQKVEMEGMGGF